MLLTQVPEAGFAVQHVMEELTQRLLQGRHILAGALRGQQRAPAADVGCFAISGGGTGHVVLEQSFKTSFIIITLFGHMSPTL